jgi:hypothetical protein
MKKFILILLLPAMSGMLLLSCSKKGSTSPAPVDTTPTNTVKYIDTLPPGTPLKHPGGLQVAEDFARIKANLTVDPWLSGWNKLIANAHAQSSWVASPTDTLIRGGSSREEPSPDNYSHAYNDAAAAYQLGIRWKISGDTVYAKTAVKILNAWVATCKAVNGDPNVALGAGFYGYQFAIAGEQLRDYSGWLPADFQAFQQWMLKVFYTVNHSYLLYHQNSCAEHYWANWDLCNLASVMAIGILTDNRSLYNEAIYYLQHSNNGNGNLQKTINYVFTGADSTLAQIQESGRDQGHATLVISLLGVICELAWHQGDDFYGFNNNAVLKATEYTAKYNVAKLDVPFHAYTYFDCSNTTTLTQISSDSRGTVRPMWAVIYNHYVKRKGLSAPYTLMGVNTTFPEGGGGDYGPNSGGYDQLGFGTLLYSR